MSSKSQPLNATGRSRMKRAHISRRRFVQMAGAAGVVPLGSPARRAAHSRSRGPAHTGGTWRRVAAGRSGWLQGGRAFNRRERNRHHRHGNAGCFEAGGEGERESGPDLRAYVLFTGGRPDAGSPRRDAGQAGSTPTILCSRQNANSSRRTAWSCFACAIIGRRAKRMKWSPALPARSAGRRAG